jgi:hypothetical protein
MNTKFRIKIYTTVILVTLFLNLNLLLAFGNNSKVGTNLTTNKQRFAKMLTQYFEDMSEPEPFIIRKGDEFKEHQRELSKKIFHSVGLEPLPERISLDVHESEPLDHPWCTVKRIYYQLWPGVYTDGFLWMPKVFKEKPAPAILCPHGHWGNVNAHPDVQMRCIMFAKMGYVVFSPVQYHYEDLRYGISSQTLMIWTNMRALDYLESLEVVDGNRMGVCGASGGGLETQMLVALDKRIKAATIVGATCDYREILFPYDAHCMCNHFPWIMRHTDHPEISALGLPSSVQYLTMDDWTKMFEHHNFPTIQKLYTENGVAEKTSCFYWPTEHVYNKQKREMTYWWMERWVRENENARIIKEPFSLGEFLSTQKQGSSESRWIHNSGRHLTFPINQLIELTIPVPEDEGFDEISNFYSKNKHYKTPAISNRSNWIKYRKKMLDVLNELLGEEQVLPKEAINPEEVGMEEKEAIIIEKLNFPTEGPIFIPTLVLRPKKTDNRLPLTIICSNDGKDRIIKNEESDSPMSLVKKGALVVLPDIRFVGELSFSNLCEEMGPELLEFKPTGYKVRKAPSGPKSIREKKMENAWERNAICWGRPIPGMASTDIKCVLDGVLERYNIDTLDINLVGKGSNSISMAVLLAGAMDNRVTSVDVDVEGASYEKWDVNLSSKRPVVSTGLPAIPFIMEYGDIPQLAALFAERELTIRNFPTEVVNAKWLESVFDTVGGTLKIEKIDNEN